MRPSQHRQSHAGYLCSLNLKSDEEDDGIPVQLLVAGRPSLDFLQNATIPVLNRQSEPRPCCGCKLDCFAHLSFSCAESMSRLHRKQSGDPAVVSSDFSYSGSLASTHAFTSCVTPRLPAHHWPNGCNSFRVSFCVYHAMTATVHPSSGCSGLCAPWAEQAFFLIFSSCPFWSFLSLVEL